MLPFLLFRVGAVPSATQAGFRGALAFWIGGAGSAPSVTPPRRAVGKIGEGGGRRRRLTVEEFERALKAQRDNAFGRRWFDEFQAAERAAAAAAADAKQKARRKALERAAEAAQALRDEAEASEARFDPAPLVASLEAAAGAAKLKDAIEASKHAVAIANALMAAIRQAEDDDEEEAVALLLLS